MHVRRALLDFFGNGASTRRRQQNKVAPRPHTNSELSNPRGRLTQFREHFIRITFRIAPYRFIKNRKKSFALKYFHHRTVKTYVHNKITPKRHSISAFPQPQLTAILNKRRVRPRDCTYPHLKRVAARSQKKNGHSIEWPFSFPALTESAIGKR
jgi:hypothetical protein